MTKTVWKDTATGKIYSVNKVEDAAAEISIEMSSGEICALIDEQCSKVELIKFLINRKNVYDIARLVLIKRLEQIEVNISKKWIEDNTEREFCSYTELLDYINKEYLDDDLDDDDNELLVEYLDNSYEASDIFRAIERGRYKELITQAKSEIIQKIIDTYFTVKEEEI